MNDEKFELTISDLAGSGTYYADIADELRARDTAQREALARVEAERDEAREFMRINAKSGMTYAEQRDIAQAQLAEAVVLLKEVGAYFGWVPMPSLVGNIANFLARHAQAEQQDVPKRGKPDWNSHGYDQIFQTSDGNWFGARAGWDFKGHISGGWKGREVSLLRDDGGFLAYGESNPNWENSLEQRPAQEAQGAQAGDERTKFIADEAFWVAQVLGDIGGMEAFWIEEDEVELTLEDDDGNSTTCTVSITEFSRRAASLIRELQARAALATQPAVEEVQAEQARGERAAFESWTRVHNESLKDDCPDQSEDIKLDRQGGVYCWSNTDCAWKAWKARAAFHAHPDLLEPWDVLEALADGYERGYQDGQSSPNGYSDKLAKHRVAAELLAAVRGAEHGQ